MARWRRATVAALVVGATISLVPGAARGQPTDSDGPPPTATVRLVEQSAWVAPDGSFELRLQIDGAPSDAIIEIRVHDNVAGLGRIRFSQTITGESLTPLRSTAVSLPLGALPTDTAGSVRASIPTSSGSPPPPFGVRLDDQGVYPVEIEVLDADGTPLGGVITHLIRLPAGAPGMSPLAVALIVPVAASPAFQPDRSVAFERSERARVEQTIDVITTWPGVNLTVNPSPETIEALAAADPAGAGRVAALAATLAGRQVLGSTFVPIDVGSLAAADDPLADDELVRQMESGRFVLERLLDTRPDTRTLVTGPSSTNEVLRRFRSSGADRFVVPAGALDPPDGQAGQPLAQVFDLVAEGVLPTRSAATDESILSRLTETADPVLNAHLLLADLAMIHYFAPSSSQGIIVDVPGDLSVAAETWEALFAALDQRTPDESASPIVTPVTLDDLFEVTAELRATDGVGVAQRQYVAPAVEPATELLAAVASTRARIGAFASMVGTGPGARWVAVLDRQVLIAEARSARPERRALYLAEVGRFIDDQTAQIITPASQSLTLTSRSGGIPVVLENRLDYPVDVEVVLTSDKLDFPDGNAPVVSLPPQSTTRHVVAVESLATGAFPLDVVVRSPDDGIQLATSRFTVRSTAISGVGLLLSVGAGAFLLLWWASHFRTTRRDRRLVTSSHPSLRPEDGTAPADPSATLPSTTSAPGVTEGEHVERPHRH
jgi:hypothetical protein